MDEATLNQHLSQIGTLWSKVVQAHGADAKSATLAQALLLERYGGAAYRYLLGAVRDPDVADDLAQEFALRFLRGDFRRADPDRGRFRDYLKTALIHLVTDHYRGQQALPRRLSADAPEPVVVPVDGPEADEEFVASWRAELLDRAWKILARDSTAFHVVLRFHVQNPETTSAQAAQQVSAQLGRPVTADWLRQTLKRAHAKYADLLLDEVVHSLSTATPEVPLRQELQELGLLKYCRSALAKRCPEASEPVRDRGQDP